MTLAEALEAAQSAHQADPGDANCAAEYGRLLAAQWRHEEAVHPLLLAVALDPLYAGAWSVLGGVLAQLGREDEALAAWDKALTLSPDMPSARWNRSLLHLLSEDRWAEGWEDYRWGTTNGMRPVRHPAPEWSGERIRGTLLLWAEQGIGDTLMCLRWVSAAREMSGASRVVLEVQPELTALALTQDACADAVYARPPDRGMPVPFDAHCSLMSLPRVLGVRRDTLSGTPYLKAPGSMDWPQSTDQRIGLVWKGSPSHPANHLRSLEVADLAPLLKIPGIEWHSLQVGEPAPEGTQDTAAGISDWVQTAVLLNALDLLVTCDTAIAHLAGGLGVPAWVFIPSMPDWRWGRAGTRTPFYDSLVLFRQRPGEPKAHTIASLAHALRGRAHGWNLDDAGERGWSVDTPYPLPVRG